MSAVIANLVNLRAAVVARLRAAEVVPEGAVLDARLAESPSELPRSVVVSIASDTGSIGPSANIACDGDVVVLLEVVARGQSDSATMNVLDATYWACVTALLVDPAFRNDWPVTRFESSLVFMPEAGRAVFVRMVKVTFQLPLVFNVEALDQLRSVAGGLDLDATPNPEAAPDVEASFTVGQALPPEDP